MIIRLGFRTVEQVGYESTQNGADETEHGRPEKRHVQVHNRFGNEPGDQANDDIPK